MKNMLWVVWFQLKMMVQNWKMGLVLLIAPVLFVIGLGIVANQLVSEEARVQLFKVAVVDRMTRWKPSLSFNSLYKASI